MPDSGRDLGPLRIFTKNEKGPLLLKLHGPWVELILDRKDFIPKLWNSLLQDNLRASNL